MSSFASNTKSEMLILSGMILTPRKSDKNPVENGDEKVSKQFQTDGETTYPLYAQ